MLVIWRCICSTCPTVVRLLCLATSDGSLDLPNFAVVYKFWRQRVRLQFDMRYGLFVASNLLHFVGSADSQSETARAAHTDTNVSVQTKARICGCRYAYNEVLNTFGLTFQAFLVLIIQNNV